MNNRSQIWPLFIASFVFAFAACTNPKDPDIETRTLSATESRRQIELLEAIFPKDCLGKRVSDFPELFSLADEIHKKNDKIVCYKFHRKGKGGNDDGSDSVAFMEVEDGVIRYFGLISYPS